MRRHRQHAQEQEREPRPVTFAITEKGLAALRADRIHFEITDAGRAALASPTPRPA